MPCLVDLQPSGEFLMEDFYYAGGLPVVMREIGELLHKDALTVNGKTLWDNMQGRGQLQRRGHHAARQAVQAARRHRGAARQPRAARRVIKPSAATPALMKHKGRAVVFEDIDDLHARIDDPTLDVDPRLRAGAQELRAEGLPRLSRGRQLRAAARRS